MATVWRVSHPRHNTPLALKVISFHSTEKNTQNNSLDQELLTLARLDHPNVIRLLDFGRINSEDAEKYNFPENGSWLVFEYVKGHTIIQQTKEKNWSFIRRIILQLLEALAHVHARGIIHRDICPSNVLWDSRERCLKLIDFGIALQKDQSEDPFAGYGSYGYTPPEVSNGGEIGPWSDLYSAGYLFSVMLSHLESLPKGLYAWISKLTNREISHRFQRVADAIYAFSQLPSLSLHETENEIQQLHPLSTAMTSVTLTIPLDSMPPPQFNPQLTEPSKQDLKQFIPPFPKDWRSITTSTVALDWTIPSISLLFLRPPRLVGREQEQNWLWEHLGKSIAENTSHILRIEGEKGIGVSRLMLWLGHRAHETGAGDVHYLSEPRFDVEKITEAATIRPQVLLFDGNPDDIVPEIPALSQPILFVIGRAQYPYPEQITETQKLSSLPKKYWLALLSSFATISPMTASWLALKGTGHPAKQRALLTQLLEEKVLIQGQSNLIWSQESTPPQFSIETIEKELSKMDKNLYKGVEAINLYPLYHMWKYLQSQPPEDVADILALVWRKLSNSAIDVEDSTLLNELLQKTSFLPYTNPKEQFRVKRRIIHLNMALNNYEQTNKLSIELLNSLTDHNSREYLFAHWQYSLDLFLQGQLQVSYERYLFTKEQAARLQAKDLEIYSLIGMGIAKGYAGEFTISIQLLKEAEEILLEQGQSFTMGTLYEMYTVNYLGLQDMTEAKASILKCFQIHRRQGKHKPINALMLWLAIEHKLKHDEQALDILRELDQRISGIEPSIQAFICLYHYYYSDEEYEKIAYWNKHLRLLEYHPSIDSLQGVLYREILESIPESSSIKSSVQQTYTQFWEKLGWDSAERWGCYPLIN